MSLSPMDAEDGAVTVENLSPGMEGASAREATQEPAVPGP